MKQILSLFALPALALAANFSGTVLDLNGTPLPGVAVKTQTDSITTSLDGKWILSRTTGVAARLSKSISVASHLVIENSRPRIVFGNVDGAGRNIAVWSEGRRSVSPLAARAMGPADSETLTVFWKGKRLVVLPVGGDSGNILFKIDTAWKDDAGIPWNPLIDYGSLHDDRDGQTYRTVRIGTQTWMGENLNYAVDSSWFYWGPDITHPNGKGGYDSMNENPTKGARYGRLYQWVVLMDLPLNCPHIGCLYPDSCKEWSCEQNLYPKIRGICPSGWHVPKKLEWEDLQIALSADDRVSLSRFAPTLKYSDIVGWNPYGLALKATTGWKQFSDGFGGWDIFGFRGLPAGLRWGKSFLDATRISYWWSATEIQGGLAEFKSLSYGMASLESFRNSLDDAYSARCIKD